jgi:hypothetical protein
VSSAGLPTWKVGGAALLTGNQNAMDGFARINA